MEGMADQDFRVVFGRTKIDYDPTKETANRAKHGYSLESAVYLLERIMLPLGGKVHYAVSDPFHENGEVRHMHMSVDDDGIVVLMVTTMRSDETVRIISFRRAHESERLRFEQLTGYRES
ncbi:BrnT family toxin [Halomonas llamarensis]|uniref:BrnT family toxin n=1 Tax=Halomonas llamarensis TaxID=2945104 RepID=A0ABT0SPP0_9GAMM|nr:BrnT family toxin [Halomonas llamarensis]MCL7929701.1 BrnT family toxin [Halomonas llamarensis]